jgi:hypothetical protein
MKRLSFTGTPSGLLMVKICNWNTGRPRSAAPTIEMGAFRET